MERGKGERGAAEQGCSGKHHRLAAATLYDSLKPRAHLERGNVPQVVKRSLNLSCKAEQNQHQNPKEINIKERENYTTTDNKSGRLRRVSRPRQEWHTFQRLTVLKQLVLTENTLGFVVLFCFISVNF